MNYIDTHSHIYLEQFDDDQERVVIRAKENGITKILLPNVDSTTMTAMLQTEKKFPDVCHAMAGVHPCSVKENFEEELKVVENELARRKYIAVGEIGIDLYWDQSTLPQQVTAFKHQLNLAIQYNIPVVIHIRNSFDEVFKALESMTSLPKGIFHCFSGDAKQASKAIEMGFLLGIGGVVTFKNSNLRNDLLHVPLEKIVLETDAPYLAPVPYRGKRNEPSYIPIIAQKLAEIYKENPGHIAGVTTKNANALFDLK